MISALSQPIFFIPHIQPLPPVLLNPYGKSFLFGGRWYWRPPSSSSSVGHARANGNRKSLPYIFTMRKAFEVCQKEHAGSMHTHVRLSKTAAEAPLGYLQYLPLVLLRIGGTFALLAAWFGLVHILFNDSNHSAKK